MLIMMTRMLPIAMIRKTTRITIMLMNNGTNADDISARMKKMRGIVIIIRMVLMMVMAVSRVIKTIMIFIILLALQNEYNNEA